MKIFAIPQQRLTPLLALLGASPFVILALWNLWTPYSYWFDELWSVAWSSDSWGRLFWMVSWDVHPPLYNVVLKIWIGLLGSGEVQTRALSALFSLVALGVLITLLRGRRPLFVLTVTLFFSSSWLFSYHAQEVRSYSLMLLLATAATVMDLGQRNALDRSYRLAWYGVLTLLSLTHYFGLVFAGVLLLGDLARPMSWRARLERVAVGAIMLVWPLYHVTFGSVARRSGGNFWITSNGIADTLNTFALSLLQVPYSLVAKIPFVPQTGTLFVIAIITSAVLVWSLAKAPSPARRDLLSLVLRIIGFVCILALIDLHTPMSTARNYIVLLPALALCFGFVMQSLWDAHPKKWQRALWWLYLLAYSASAGRLGLLKMEERWAPRENWKGLAAVVDGAGICQPHCWFAHNSGPVYAFYFREAMGADPSAVTLSAEELVSLPKERQYPIIAAHVDGIRKWDDVRAFYSDWQCLTPHQSWPNSVFLLAPKSMVLKRLQRCP